MSVKLQKAPVRDFKISLIFFWQSSTVWNYNKRCCLQFYIFTILYKKKVRNLQYFIRVWKVWSSFFLTSFLFHPGDVMAARTRSSLVGEHCLEFIEPTVVGSQICKWCIRCFYSSGVFKMTRHWKIYKNIKSFIKLNSMYNQMTSTQYGICSTFKIIK